MRLTGHRSCRQGLSVRLFLTDLDNTLVDRSDAFRRWACGFVAELGLPIEEVDNIEAIDAGGTIPRGELFATLVAHYGLDANKTARHAGPRTYSGPGIARSSPEASDASRESRRP